MLNLINQYLRVHSLQCKEANSQKKQFLDVQSSGSAPHPWEEASEQKQD